MGFTLAVAVVFDAFVVRMTLIPALMFLIGDNAWWLPRWLDRLLPDVDVEEKLVRPHLTPRTTSTDRPAEEDVRQESGPGRSSDRCVRPCRP